MLQATRRADPQSERRYALCQPTGYVSRALTASSPASKSLIARMTGPRSRRRLTSLTGGTWCFGGVSRGLGRFRPQSGTSRSRLDSRPVPAKGVRELACPDRRDAGRFAAPARNWGASSAESATVQNFRFYVTDDRAPNPVMMLLQARDEAAARASAERLLWNRNYHAIDVWSGDARLFSLDAPSPRPSRPSAPWRVTARRGP